jgi:Ca-activated chloride channel family protein
MSPKIPAYEPGKEFINGAIAMNSHSYRSTLIIICILMSTLGVSTLKAQTSDPDKTLSPYFFVKGDPSVDRLPLKDTKVAVALSGVIADVHVTQLYRNDGSRPINATYVFPASTRAAVYAMQMKIRDEIIYAKIKER